MRNYFEARKTVPLLKGAITTRMRIVIVGAGALGTVFGVALHRYSHEVVLLGRRSHDGSSGRTPRVVQALDGERQNIDVPVTNDPERAAEADALIVLVKARDTVEAVTCIAPFVRPESTLLTLQNGLGNARLIKNILGKGAVVLPGTTSQAAMRIGDDLIVHSGTGITRIGFQTAPDADRARLLAAMLSAAGLPTEITGDIDCWIWHKVALNAAINGVTALTGLANGAILENQELLSVTAAIAREVGDVALAHGIDVGDIGPSLVNTLRASAMNHSSMLQDIEAGRQTEVDAIHGAIVEAAVKAGVSVPMNQLLAALIRGTSRARPEEERHIDQHQDQDQDLERRHDTE